MGHNDPNIHGASTTFTSKRGQRGAKDSNHKEIKGNKIRQTRQNNGGNELHCIWTFHRPTHAGRLTDILFDILLLLQ